MKYLQNLIITGFLIPFLPMNAGTTQLGETYLETSALMEEAPMSSLDEELSLLDEEFEEFRDELFSLEESLQKKEVSTPVIAINAIEEAPAIAMKEKSLLSGILSPQAESEVAVETLPPQVESAMVVESLPPQVEAAMTVEALPPQVEAAVAVESLPPQLDTFESLFPQVESAMTVEALAPQVDTAVQTELVAELARELIMDAEELPLIEKMDLQINEEQEIMQTAIVHESPAILSVQGTAFMGELEPINKAISVDLTQAFAGSPIIYSLLLAMSVIAVSIWLYSTLSLRASARVTHSLLKNVRNKLNSNNFDEALSLCEEHNNLFCKMVSSGIHSRRHGLPVMIEAMKAEGKRTSIAFWQKIGLLNDIAVIAPMLGLLGTVLGMFYAFYDVNRSIESVSVLFDGLGISVGTTVAGLIVAILALILHSTAKYRLVRALALVENEAQNVATLIDDRTSIYKG